MNINDIIPKTKMHADDGTKIWTSKSINMVLNKLPHVKNFNQVSPFGKEYVIVSWFLLLNNEKLVSELVKNPYFEETIKYLNNGNFKNHRQPIKNSGAMTMLIEHLFKMPFLFNKDVNTVKLLQDKGLEVGYDVAECLWEHPRYILNLIHAGLLDFDEEKICKGANLIYKGESLLENIMHQNNSKLDNSQKMELINCINEFIEMGATTQISYKKVTETINCQWEEYMEINHANLYEFYCKIKLNKKLTEQLSTNKIKPLKIKI